MSLVGKWKYHDHRGANRGWDDVYKHLKKDDAVNNLPMNSLTDDESVSTDIPSDIPPYGHMSIKLKLKPGIGTLGNGDLFSLSKYEVPIASYVCACRRD